VYLPVFLNSLCVPYGLYLHLIIPLFNTIIADPIQYGRLNSLECHQEIEHKIFVRPLVGLIVWYQLLVKPFEIARLRHDKQKELLRVCSEMEAHVQSIQTTEQQKSYYVHSRKPLSWQAIKNLIAIFKQIPEEASNEQLVQVYMEISQ